MTKEDYEKIKEYLKTLTKDKLKELEKKLLKLKNVIKKK